MKTNIIFLIFLCIFQWSHTAFADGEKEVIKKRMQVAFLKEKCKSDVAPGAMAPAALAVIGLILPKVIEAGLDTGAALIKSSAEQKVDTKSKSTAEFDIAQIDYNGKISTNNQVSCLVYFDGTFQGTEVDGEFKGGDGNFDSFCPVSIGDKCGLAGAQKAYILFEAKLNLSENRRLNSNLDYLYVEEFVVKNSFLARSSTRDLIIALDFLNLESGKKLGGIIYTIDDIAEKSEISKISFENNDVPIVIPKEEFAELIDKQNIKASKVRTQIKLKFPEATEETVESVAETKVQESDVFKQYCAKAPKKVADEECASGFGVYKRALAKARAEEIKKENTRRADEWVSQHCDYLNSSAEDNMLVKKCLKTKVPPIITGKIYLKVTATETKDGSKFWTSVANVISSTKSDISKRLSTEILKDKDKIKADENETEAKKLQDLEIAKDAVMLAEVKLSSLPSDADAFTKASAQVEVKKAKLSANSASRKLGYPNPYPELP